MLGPAALLVGIQLSVPLEYTSGVGAGAPRRFEGGFRSSLLVRLGEKGQVLLGPAGGALYDGSDWAMSGGVRAGFRLPGLGARDAGVFAFAEALKGRESAPLSLLVLGDLPLRSALFARFGILLTRDLERKENSFSLVIGVDLARWWLELSGPDEPHVVHPDAE